MQERVSGTECMMDIEEILKKNHDKDIYFWGSGGVCATVLKRHSELLQEVTIKGIFDNNSDKWGMCWQGYRILAPRELSDCSPQSIIIITSSYVQQIKNQIQKYGIENIYSYQELNHIGRMFTETEIDKLQEVKKILADKKSMEIVDKIIEKRQYGNSDFSDIYEVDQYFVKEIVELGQNEVVIDGGAYIGDTALDFIKRVDGKFKSYYAFEPDQDNFKKLKQTFENDNRVYPVQAGLGSEHKVLRFIKNTDNHEAGVISEIGSEEKVIESIDDFIKEKVTFIKLDVEGYEMDTLKGAQKIIREQKPKLAICLYHKAEDLYDIPMYIHKLVPEYKLYIRHHTKGVAETVLYAINN